MADLTTKFAGIECPNPFWLASGPPANCGDQVMRAFDAGWGGAVWKTIGEPIVNVSSRYSSVDWNGQRMMGLNNIELISDRPIETNLREIAEVIAFVGVVAFRAFFEERGKVDCGEIGVTIGESRVFVLPNPSGRNANYSYAEMLDAFARLRRALES